jgi:putative transcriptional regulator
VSADPHPTIAKRIKELASKKGWSGNLLADFAGMSRGYLHEVLRGKNSPTVSTLLRIAEALEVEVIDLLKTDDEG